MSDTNVEEELRNDLLKYLAKRNLGWDTADALIAIIDPYLRQARDEGWNDHLREGTELHSV